MSCPLVGRSFLAFGAEDSPLHICDPEGLNDHGPRDHLVRAWAARTPLGRNAHADDVAGAVVLMSSPLAGFCTGAYLPANGGVIMP